MSATLEMDFETFCELDVRQVGAHRYSLHPSCEVLILCYKLPGKPIQDWLTHRDGPEIPDDLREYIEADDGVLQAHNASFEAAIWQNVLVARHGAPPVALRRWRCTAARAAAAGMPRALANLGPALRLQTVKDPEGTRLINIFCKPRKPSKLNPATRTYPDDKPEEFAKFVEYCRRDVETEMAADRKLPDLSDYEWRVYRHTEKMNERGLPLDMDAVRNGFHVLQQLEKRVVARVEELTGGIRPTQRDKMLALFNDIHGLDMENMQAKTIKDLVTLRGDALDPVAKELLLLRIEGGKASTKKLKKMLQVVCEDGIVRGCFLFHGAGTGRLAGRLIQPQNFTRGEFTPAQLEMLFSLLRHRDAQVFELLYEWPIDALAQGMRGYIKAPPGKKFVVVDFAAIEARVLVWLARQMDAVAAYHENADLYKRLAIRLYKLRSEDEVTTPQRKFAKDLFLGCLGADTKVLTLRGWVPIVEVNAGDQLWDGIEWVGTRGCVYSGNKEVIELCGITITPEHKVLCGRSWLDAARVTRSSNALQSALDTATLPSLLIGLAGAALFGGTSVYALAETVRIRVQGTWSRALQKHVTRARERRQARRLLRTANLGNTRYQKSDRSSERTESLDDSLNQGNRLSGTLANVFRAVLNTLTRVGSSTGQRVWGVISAGLGGVGSQQLMLSTDTCTFDLGTCTSDASLGTTLGTKASRSASGGLTSRRLLPTARSLKVMNQDQTCWSLTAETTTGTTSPAIVGSSRSKSTCVTADVYDLLDCGPRSRFTVLTDRGPMVVHNSGFQLGWKGFIENCLKRGIVVSEDEAKEGIGTYRDANPKVVDLWADVEGCAVRAVLTSASVTNPVQLRNLAFFVDGIWFCIKLPSGRLLRYPYPEVQNTLRYRKIVKKLTFRSEIKGKWVREGTYGGKLVENIVQAIARDLMVNACFNAEARGYPVIGTVHDELITMVDGGFGSAHELEDILRIKPKWATDCPVNAEGWEGQRYRK